MKMCPRCDIRLTVFGVVQIKNPENPDEIEHKYEYACPNCGEIYYI